MLKTAEKVAARGPERLFRSVVVVIVSVCALFILLLTSLSLSRSSPVIYGVTLALIITGFSLTIRNYHSIALLRNLTLSGTVLMVPLGMLLLTIPAAVIYLCHDLTGSATLLLLSDLFASLGAAWFLAASALVTLPAMLTVRHLLIPEEPGEEKVPWNKTLLSYLIITVVLAIIMVMAAHITGMMASAVIVILPLAAILIVILLLILMYHFRKSLEKLMMKEYPENETCQDNNYPGMKGRVASVMLVAGHFIDLISGRLDYLDNNADDGYAEEIVTVAAKTLDPGLLKALANIADNRRFGSGVREKAAALAEKIRSFYSDPQKYKEMFRLAGISDKAAMARGIILSGEKPGEQEIAALLVNSDPEVRRAGLRMAGRYNMTGLLNEVFQTLSFADTAHETYYTLREFGPQVYGKLFRIPVKSGNSVRENILLLRLLEELSLPLALPWLSLFIASAVPEIRVKAARSLCKRGWKPKGNYRHMLEEITDNTIYTLARIIVLQGEADKGRHYQTAAALRNERETAEELLFLLLILLAGRGAAEAIISSGSSDTLCRAGIASEAIRNSVGYPLQKPLIALLGHHPDRERIEQLALSYPLRHLTGRSLSSFLLASEQDITGTWTKACALHQAAGEGSGLEKELAISYLFSNSLILQEESARAVREINHAWYAEVSGRLSPHAADRIESVISNSLHETAMIFEKTKFLGLCFRSIPDEKMIMLATAMRYSETYDAGNLPGIISWIVPTKEGKTGLYSLPENDIALFAFYYPEYTDMIISYMNTLGRDAL